MIDFSEVNYLAVLVASLQLKDNKFCCPLVVQSEDAISIVAATDIQIRNV